MKMNWNKQLPDGEMAGLIGGLVIVLWYIIFDAGAGRDLSSFADVLASAFGRGGAITIFGRVVLHFGIFVVIGAISALMLEAAEWQRPLLPAMIVLVPVFDIFFIMVLMLVGPSSQESLPWWKFIMGDAMATAAMIAYFVERHPTLANQMGGRWTGVVREGAVGGLIGAVVVAVWFFIYGVFTGDVLRTPAVLGAAIFKGQFDPDRVQVTAALVLGYTASHFFAFVIFGIAVAVLLLATEYEPVFAVGVLFVLGVFEVFAICVLALFDYAALSALGFWELVIANLLAAAAMMWFFNLKHAGWLQRFRERWKVLQLKRGM
jgi:hypothetical protein